MEGFKKANVKREDEKLVISWEGEGLGKVSIYMAENADFTESAENLSEQWTGQNMLLKQQKIAAYILF